MKSIADAFQPSSFSGTCVYPVQIPLSAARGFGPELSLNYESGSGNGILGIGFSMSLPKISRRTDGGIPQYNNTDIFVSSEDGNLTPKLVSKNGGWVCDEQVKSYEGVSYNVVVYLPRKQENFALIEQWSDPLTQGASFWKVTGCNNTISFFGKSEQNRITDTDNRARIFEWLIEETFDSKGNKIVYSYKEENGKNISPEIYEANRSYRAMKYPQSIQYGNYISDSKPLTEQYSLEIVFDYGEYDITDLKPGSDPYTPVREWAERSDPFSSYRSGFEIRTYRLCRNIFVFHKFAELGEKPCLAKATQLTYNETPNFSFLQSVIHTGFRKNIDDSYDYDSLPPVAFAYSLFQPPLTPVFNLLTTQQGNTIQGYLDKSDFLPVDLKGEGLPGIFVNNAETMLYYEPLGNGSFLVPATFQLIPSGAGLQNQTISLQSLEGNGLAEMVIADPPVTGYYDLQENNEWSQFNIFSSTPTDLTNPLAEGADVNGNGKTDLLTFENDSLVYYPSIGKEGFGFPQRTTLPEGFPTTLNCGDLELVAFANIFGDGGSHRIRIRSGYAEVWPNMGYGVFGEKVALANAPAFNPDLEISRILLADVDGSGAADIVFIYADRVEVFVNQIGNSFATLPVTVYLPDKFSDLDKIQFIDILGTGTSALVFTKAGIEMKQWFFNFCGAAENPPGKGMRQTAKPYMLTRIDNNMGSVTDIFYASSTKFYLEDKITGNPWLTRLPFPVQVVEKTILSDLISGSCFTSTYKYHQGYYDAIEKEFMGFGYIEAWDAETIEEHLNRIADPDKQNLVSAPYAPPVYTRTWYNTGAMVDYKPEQYKNEYFTGDTAAYDFPDSVIDPKAIQAGLATFEQACAALKGTMLRQEVYGLDGSELQYLPYVVEQSCYEVTLLQAVENNDYATFLVSPREHISYHYERDPQDPRVEQEFILEVDNMCGQITKACSVYLPRRSDTAGDIRITASHNNYINTAYGEAFLYRGLTYQAQELEIAGLETTGTKYLSYADVAPIAKVLDNPIPYGSNFQPCVLQAKQLTWTRTSFWNEAQNAELPLGQTSSRALVHHTESALATKEVISGIFGEQLTDEVIASQGGYIYDAATGYWWNKGPTSFYYDVTQPSFFYLSYKTENANVDPASLLFVKNTVEYGTPYCLSAVKATQYIDETNHISNSVSAVIDYITLQPKQITDVNGNISQVLFDPLGMVIVSTLFGTHDGKITGGMTLYSNNGTPAEYVFYKDPSFNDVLNESEHYLQGATGYYYYNLHTYKDQQQPLCAIELKRKNFYRSGSGTSLCLAQISIGYSDGFGRSLENKIKADPSVAITRDVKGELLFNNKNKVIQAETDNCWIVSGRTVYNNKGNPCEQYLPYFSNSPLYELQQEITDLQLVPPPSILQYDPVERVIRIDTPKGFFSKVEFSPWEVKHFNEDNTVKDSPYYLAFMKNYPPDPTQQQIDEKDALDKAAVFYDAYSSKRLDSMSNVVQDVETDENAKQFISFFASDIQGRQLTAIDPRLYASNQTKGTAYYNFKYQYLMGEESPLCTDSTDAGIEKYFFNIFGNQILSISARNYCQLSTYDRAGRRHTLRVKKIDDSSPIVSLEDFNLVEVFTYGEYAEKADQYNLRGQLYQLKDLSGILTNPDYDLQGNMLQTSRQMAKEYKVAINWNNAVPLENDIYNLAYSYNALKQLLTETTPDGAVTTSTYNLTGLPYSTAVKYADGTLQPIINSINYDTNQQRTKIVFANGISTFYNYEDTTLRLIRLYSLKNAGKTVQAISYTYDPIGNITRSRDNTAETIFNNNQKVAALSDYTYDYTSRLIKASGRQHPGINGNTFKDNKTEGSFKQSIFSQLPSINDADKLENYNELYTYDDSGNLIKKQHIATSASFTTETNVEDNNNRLKAIPYDLCGNQIQLSINNKVSLYYNCCENLIKAGIIERLDEPDDCDYYVYDSTGARTRKVSERLAQGGSVTEISEKIYLGRYEIKSIKTVSGDKDPVVKLQRQTLKVMCGGVCMAIMHYWVKDDIKREVKATGERSLRFQMGNNLGSVSMEVDVSARLISYEEYFPFGGTAIIAGENQKEVSLKDYRYSGKECDDTTGLYYYGARYYISWLSRWTRPDPAGVIDGFNLYAFVGGNPIVHTDFGGLMKTRSQSKKRPYKEVKIDGKSKRQALQEAKRRARKEEDLNTRRSFIGRPKSSDEATVLTSYVNTQGFIFGKSYKTNAIRVQWKGTRSSGGTSGIELGITTRDSRSWSGEQVKRNQELGAQFLKDSSFTGIGRWGHGAEISHAIAGSNYGPNDELSAHPASVHQNTEWLAIETGVKDLINGGVVPIVKVTQYVHDGTDGLSGTLKAARYKIYIGKNKVFDHVALGNRGNIDSGESNVLYSEVSSLSSSSTSLSTSSTKGLHGTPPSLSSIRSNRTDSSKSPMFTDISYNSTVLTGGKALKYMQGLY